MFDNRPLQENGLPAYEAGATELAPQETVWDKVQRVMARLAQEPRDIVWLARAGKNQQASARCMVDSGLALTFAIGWLTIVPCAGVLGFVMVVPAGPGTQVPPASWLMDAVMLTGLIPSLIAFLIVPVLSLPGTILGFISLLQADSNKLKGIGCTVANLLLSAVWAFVGLAMIALWL